MPATRPAKPTKKALASRELTTTMTIRMPLKLREQLRKAAFVNRQDDSVLARDILHDALKRVQP